MTRHKGPGTTTRLLTYRSQLHLAVFMGFSIMGVVLQPARSISAEIVNAQHRLWFCVPQFVGLRRLLVAGLAETAGRPSTSPRRESELVAGLPHGIFRHQVRHVLHRRVPRHHPDVRPDRPPSSSAAGWALAARTLVWFAPQDVRLHRRFHPRAGDSCLARDTTS